MLVKESGLLARAPSTAAEFLKGYPASPYTALLVTKLDRVSSFDLHCKRLTTGLTALTAPTVTHTVSSLEVGVK